MTQVNANRESSIGQYNNQSVGSASSGALYLRKRSLTGSQYAEINLRFIREHANVTVQLVRGEPFLARCEMLTEILGAPKLEDCTPIKH